MEEMLEIFGLEFGGSFFIYAFPWLLVFALVYGILSMIGKDGEGVPQSDAARAIISIVLAFFSLLFAEPLMAFLQAMGGSSIIVLTTFLFFLVLLELTQTGGGAYDLIGKYPKTFGFIILIVIVVLFLGAGGGEMLGLGEIAPYVEPTTMFFLAVVALAIWWMVSESESKEGD